MNFVKFLRTPFLTEHLRWLLLKVSKKYDALFKFLFASDLATNSRVSKQPFKALLKKDRPKDFAKRHGKPLRWR